MALTDVARYCLVAGGTTAVAGWGLFFRMAVEINKVLPPTDRIPVGEIRYRFYDVVRLHGERFPRSPVRLSFLVLMGVALALLAVGIVAGIG